MSSFKFSKQIYSELLPLFLPYSTAVGFLTGLTALHDKSSINNFANIIGYTSLGIITGITFPVSFPLLGCYVLYKNK